MIELKEKIRGDIDEEVKEIESITEPNSIYPKILELHKETKPRHRRAKHDPFKGTFEEFMEYTQ